MRELRMTNEELIAAMKTAWRDEGNLMAQCIARLADVDERRLYLDVASPSLFDFCVRKIGMSEGEAFRRMTAARLVQKHPQILVALEAQRVHLSSIVLARKLFKAAKSADAILELITGKTRREVQKIIACVAPRPDVPSSIRKMRTPKRGAAPALTGAGAPASASAPAAAAAPASASASAVSSLPLAFVPDSSPWLMDIASATEVFAEPAKVTTSSERADAEGGAIAMGANAPSPIAPSPQTAAQVPSPGVLVGDQILPLAASRHHVQFTASTELREKLERAQSLMRHRNIDGDLAVVVDRALDLLIAKLEKEKLGKTSARTRESGAPPLTSRPESSEVSKSLATGSSPAREPAHAIPSNHTSTASHAIPSRHESHAISSSHAIPSSQAVSSHSNPSSPVIRVSRACLTSAESRTRPLFPDQESPAAVAAPLRTPNPAVRDGAGSELDSDPDAEKMRGAPNHRSAVPAAARREVMRRDREQCSFVSAEGERCPARDLLEIDHRHARALGGSNEVSNLRLLCRSHNLHAAERTFGQAHVARAIDLRRRTRAEQAATVPLAVTAEAKPPGA